MELRFECEKATQALAYFAQEQGGTINKMKALKLVFFADRYHLRKYGRTVTGDEYWAMDFGPVPSLTKNVAERVRLSRDEENYVAQFLRPLADIRGIVEIQGICAPDLEALSESDEEALGFAWREFGANGAFHLVDLTHIYPEWRNCKNNLLGDRRRVSMKLEEFFEDPPSELLEEFEIEDPFATDRAGLEATRDMFREQNRIEKLLGR